MALPQPIPVPSVARRQFLKLIAAGGGVAALSVVATRPVVLSSPPGGQPQGYVEELTFQGLIGDPPLEPGKMWFRQDLSRFRVAVTSLDMKTIAHTDDPPALHDLGAGHTGSLSDSLHGSRGAGLHTDSHTRVHSIADAADHSGSITDGQHGSRGSALHADSHPQSHGDADHTNKLSDHQAAGDPHPQYATDTDLSTHAAAADPHTGYQRESEKAAANGYASLDGSILVPVAQIPAHDILTKHNGFPGGTTNFLRADGSFAAPPGGGGEAFPVGSVFIAVVSTNPATLLGYGTWAAFAAGRVLVGLDAGQTEFDTVEETGGAKTHTLTEAEMPAHAHNPQRYPTATGGNTSFTVDTSMSGTPATTSLDTGSKGGGGAHNNLQPYIVVYMWKRTA